MAVGNEPRIPETNVGGNRTVDTAVGNGRIGSERGDDGLVSIWIQVDAVVVLAGRSIWGAGFGRSEPRRRPGKSFRFQIDEECGVWIMSKVDLAAETSSKVMYVKCQK